MVKRTKAQKKRACKDMNTKATILFVQGLISAKDAEVVMRISSKALNKIK